MEKANAADSLVAPGEISNGVRSSPNGYLVSKGYAWYVFFLVFTLMLFDFIDRQVIASLFPYFKREWGISDTQCGVLVAAVNWSITAFAIPVGLLADRWSRKKTVGLMSIVWSLATLACAFTTNFKQLLVARFVIGVGEAGYVPVGNSLISVFFPKELRSRLTGLFVGASPLGSAFGLMLGGWIAAAYGWRHAFGIVAIPGLFFAALFFFTRDYKTVALTVSDHQNKDPNVRRALTKMEIVKVLLFTPSLVAIYFGSFLGTFYTGVIMNWTPSFFHRVHHLTVADAGTKAGLILFGAIAGNYLGGFLADKLVSWGRVNGRLLAAGILEVLAFMAFTSVFCLLTGSTQVILLIISGFVLTAYAGPVYSALPELVHPGLRSTVVSVMTLIQNVLGFALGPIVAGAISDRYGIETAMIVCSFVPILTAASYFVAAAFYARDLSGTEKIEIQAED